MSDEGSFPLITIIDSNVVIAPSHIKFGEDISVFYLTDEVRDKRERVGIFDCVFINISVVLTRSEAIVTFSHKEKERCLRGIRGSYFPRFEVSSSKFLAAFSSGVEG